MFKYVMLSQKCNEFLVAAEYCGNRLSSFCVILLTNKQTNKQSVNKTSLIEVKTHFCFFK